MATEVDGHAEAVHLRMFGGLEWTLNGSTVAIPGGKPESILVHLVAQHGSVVATDALIDRLWGAAPRSGANAVQRHIHRLRGHLGELGSPDPSSIIETIGSGYRLNPAVTSDLSELEIYLSSPDDLPLAESVDWWLPPLGATASTDTVLAAALGTLAVKTAKEWGPRALRTGRNAEVLRRVGSLADHHAYDRDLWHLLLDAAQAAGDRATIDAIIERVRSNAGTSSAVPSALMRRVDNVARSRTTRSAGDPTHDGRQLLSQIGSLWLAGNEAAALDLVEDDREILHPDTRRRVVRWLVWIPRSDNFGRACWHLWSVENELAPEHAERSIVSLDARALEHMDDPLEVVDAEVEAAADEPTLTRSLRVRFMVGLGWPMSDRQTDTVGRLDSLATPDAQVEASRFRAILEIKAGHYHAGVRLLDDYRSRVRLHWPHAGDDFDGLTMAALSLHPDSASLGFDTFGTDRYPTFTSDPEAHDVAVAWSLLQGHRDPLNRPPDQWLGWLRHEGATSWSADAYELALTRERLSPAADPLARVLEAATGARRDRSYQTLLWAMTAAAVRWKDQELAGITSGLLEPWADEELGIWPMDALLGPAQRALERLDELS